MAFNTVQSSEIFVALKSHYISFFATVESMHSVLKEDVHLITQTTNSLHGRISKDEHWNCLKS